MSLLKGIKLAATPRNAFKAVSALLETFSPIKDVAPLKCYPTEDFAPAKTLPCQRSCPIKDDGLTKALTCRRSCPPETLPPRRCYPAGDIVLPETSLIKVISFSRSSIPIPY